MELKGFSIPTRLDLSSDMKITGITIPTRLDLVQNPILGGFSYSFPNEDPFPYMDLSKDFSFHLLTRGRATLPSVNDWIMVFSLGKIRVIQKRIAQGYRFSIEIDRYQFGVGLSTLQIISTVGTEVLENTLYSIHFTHSFAGGVATYNMYVNNVLEATGTISQTTYAYYYHYGQTIGLMGTGLGAVDNAYFYSLQCFDTPSDNTRRAELQKNPRNDAYSPQHFFLPNGTGFPSIQDRVQGLEIFANSSKVNLSGYGKILEIKSDIPSIKQLLHLSNFDLINKTVTPQLSLPDASSDFTYNFGFRLPAEQIAVGVNTYCRIFTIKNTTTMNSLEVRYNYFTEVLEFVAGVGEAFVHTIARDKIAKINLSVAITRESGLIKFWLNGFEIAQTNTILDLTGSTVIKLGNYD